MCWFSRELQQVFQFDLAVFFGMRSAPHAFFSTGIELKHVAWPAEHGVCPSARK